MTKFKVEFTVDGKWYRSQIDVSNPDYPGAIEVELNGLMKRAKEEMGRPNGLVRDLDYREIKE